MIYVLYINFYFLLTTKISKTHHVSLSPTPLCPSSWAATTINTTNNTLWMEQGGHYWGTNILIGHTHAATKNDNWVLGCLQCHCSCISQWCSYNGIPNHMHHTVHYHYTYCVMARSCCTLHEACLGWGSYNTYKKALIISQMSNAIDMHAKQGLVCEM